MRYKIINGERIEYNYDTGEFKYKKVLSLKKDINPEVLLSYGFKKEGLDFERCLIGYLNYIIYDTKRNILVQKVAKPNFQSEDEYTNADRLLEIIKNHNEFYTKQNIVFGINLQDLFEVRKWLEE